MKNRSGKAPGSKSLRPTSSTGRGKPSTKRAAAGAGRASASRSTDGVKRSGLSSRPGAKAAGASRERADAGARSESGGRTSAARKSALGKTWLGGAAPKGMRDKRTAEKRVSSRVQSSRDESSKRPVNKREGFAADVTDRSRGEKPTRARAGDRFGAPSWARKVDEFDSRDGFGVKRAKRATESRSDVGLGNSAARTTSAKPSSRLSTAPKQKHRVRGEARGSSSEDRFDGGDQLIWTANLFQDTVKKPGAKSIGAGKSAATKNAPNKAVVSPEVRQITIDSERDGQRLDNFLFTQLKGVPKSLIYRVLRTGQVRINGKRVKQDTRLVTNDIVRVPPIRVAEPNAPVAPGNKNLDTIRDSILLEDKNFLVLNKPSGIATHGGSGINHGAIELLRAAFPTASLELVHRLDRDTSGVLVVAKKRAALRGLQELIRQHQVRKKYLALLVGVLDRDKVLVDVALSKQTLRGGERMVQVDQAEGKPSRSTFRVIKRFANATLVEVDIETGRTHQIRVHSQHLGHPVAGDEKYGDKAANKALKEYGLKRLFLHAKEMSFALPEAETYAFVAPLPEDLSDVVEHLSM